MNIIRMSGGIGNQMFQYALYLKLVSMGREVKFDDVTEYLLSNARPIMLSVFDLDYPRATEKEVEEATDSSMAFLKRLRRLLFGRRSREYHEYSINYDGVVLEKKDAYLCGCFQSERYFKDIEDKVREAFQFRNMQIPGDIRERIEDYERQIGEGMSVSVHIRRGDYLDAEAVYGGICTEAYYDGAIAYMLEKYPKAHFFIFTNDVPWAKKWCEKKEKQWRMAEGEGTEGPAFTVIEGTSENTGYIDLMLMSRCKAHIIANSSFSWWGAWLNPRKDKCVIAPEKWLNTQECRDIFTPGMIRIDAGGRVL